MYMPPAGYAVLVSSVLVYGCGVVNRSPEETTQTQRTSQGGNLTTGPSHSIEETTSQPERPERQGVASDRVRLVVQVDKFIGNCENELPEDTYELGVRHWCSVLRVIEPPDFAGKELFFVGTGAPTSAGPFAGVGKRHNALMARRLIEIPGEFGPRAIEFEDSQDKEAGATP